MAPGRRSRVADPSLDLPARTRAARVFDPPPKASMALAVTDELRNEMQRAILLIYSIFETL